MGDLKSQEPRCRWYIFMSSLIDGTPCLQYYFLCLRPSLYLTFIISVGLLKTMLENAYPSLLCVLIRVTMCTNHRQLSSFLEQNIGFPILQLINVLFHIICNLICY